MSPKDIQALTAHLQASGLAAARIQIGDATLRLQWRRKLQPGVSSIAVAPTPPPRQEDNRVKAPHAGVFLSSHPLAERPIASAVVGQVVGYLQVGRVLTAVVAARAGHITALVADGTLVGFGEPVLQID